MMRVDLRKGIDLRETEGIVIYINIYLVSTVKLFILCINYLLFEIVLIFTQEEKSK